MKISKKKREIFIFFKVGNSLLRVQNELSDDIKTFL